MSDSSGGALGESSPAEVARAAKQARSAGAAALVVALWAATAPYSARLLGLGLPVEPLVEVVDHVIPALVIGVVAVRAIIRRSWGSGSAVLMTLAGLWMFATHIPLIVAARDGSVDAVAAWWHGLPGVVAFLAGAVMIFLTWD